MRFKSVSSLITRMLNGAPAARKAGATVISLATITAFAALFTLTACNSAAPEPADKDIARAERMRPTDLALAERYERSCITCHGRPGAGAPLTGFAPAWKAPLKKGMPQLLQNAKQGINAMPALGMCNDCTDAQLQQLIEFMSGKV